MLCDKLNPAKEIKQQQTPMSDQPRLRGAALLVLGSSVTGMAHGSSLDTIYGTLPTYLICGTILGLASGFASCCFYQFSLSGWILWGGVLGILISHSAGSANFGAVAFTAATAIILRKSGPTIRYTVLAFSSLFAGTAVISYFDADRRYFYLILSSRSGVIALTVAFVIGRTMAYAASINRSGSEKKGEVDE